MGRKGGEKGAEEEWLMVLEVSAREFYFFCFYHVCMCVSFATISAYIYIHL
jgi:hypothetical protein